MASPDLVWGYYYHWMRDAALSIKGNLNLIWHFSTSGMTDLFPSLKKFTYC